MLFDMRANVSELLRNFPAIRRAAMAGERVVIETREGNLVLMAEASERRSLFGALGSSIDSNGLTETHSGASEEDWKDSL